MGNKTKLIKRFQNLDILRGIAIISVVFYHSYVTIINDNNYKNNIDTLFIYNISFYGYLGVYLFFIISGFVITQSLSKYSTITFLKKRWNRLFTPILLASICIVLLNVINGNFSKVNMLNFLISIFFLDPLILNNYFNLSVQSLSGVFWSLVVEVKFYLISAILWFFFKKNFKYVICIFYLYYLTFKYLSIFFPNETFIFLNQIGKNFSFAYFVWFSIGIFYYYYYYEKKKSDLYLFVLFSFLGSLHVSRLVSLDVFILSCLMIFIFFISFYIRIFNHLNKTNRFFIFFGLVSYELYLIHYDVIYFLSKNILNLFDHYNNFLILIYIICAIIVAKANLNINQIFDKKYL